MQLTHPSGRLQICSCQLRMMQLTTGTYPQVKVFTFYLL